MHVALIAPEIPPNTGNVARLCAATNTPLHLVRPLGFQLEDRQLKRAGLDYWQHVDLRIHDSVEDFFRIFPAEQCYFLSTKGSIHYTDIHYAPDDVLVFGSETAGLPTTLLTQYPERVLTIPMSGPVRSINLATAVGVVLFEGLRQLLRRP